LQFYTLLFVVAALTTAAEALVDRSTYCLLAVEARLATDTADCWERLTDVVAGRTCLQKDSDSSMVSTVLAASCVTDADYDRVMASAASALFRGGSMAVQTTTVSELEMVFF